MWQVVSRSKPINAFKNPAKDCTSINDLKDNEGIVQINIDGLLVVEVYSESKRFVLGNESGVFEIEFKELPSFTSGAVVCLECSAKWIGKRYKTYAKNPLTESIGKSPEFVRYTVGMFIYDQPRNKVLLMRNFTRASINLTYVIRKHLNTGYVFEKANFESEFQKMTNRELTLLRGVRTEENFFLYFRTGARESLEITLSLFKKATKNDVLLSWLETKAREELERRTEEYDDTMLQVWVPPKGRLELTDKTEEECAIREAKEELYIEGDDTNKKKIDKLKIEQRFEFLEERDGMQLKHIYFIAVCDEENDKLLLSKPQTNEHSDIDFYTVDDAKTKLPEKLFKALHNAI
jgi:8-oxo-dGTP pyrophosphatase MutT (NUDIX family)